MSTKDKAEPKVNEKKTEYADESVKDTQAMSDKTERAPEDINLSGMIEGSERLKTAVKKDQKIIEIHFPKDANYKDWDLKTLSVEIVRTYKSTYKRFTVQFIFSGRTLITII